MSDYVVLQDPASTDVVVIEKATAVSTQLLSSGPPGAKGDPGSAGEGYATRTALASAGNAASDLDDAFLTESGREGKFVFAAGDQSANVTWDTEQGVYIPKASATSGSGGAWVRIGRLHPRHFGIIPGDGSDHGAKLNKFFVALNEEGGKRDFGMEGAYTTAQELVIDAGTYGNPPLWSLDWEGCQITSLAAMDRLLTLRDCYAGRFKGIAHLLGNGVTGGSSASDWTTMVGVYLDGIGGSQVDSIETHGFGYAGIETAKINNDSAQIAHLIAKRCGSGAPSISATANWTKISDEGDPSSFDQYTEIEVDDFPPLYLQERAYLTTGISDHDQPLRQTLVDIGGQLRLVKAVFPSTNRLRVYPWLETGMGSSGSLTYHWGGGIVLRGTDSQLLEIGQVDANISSTAVEFSAQYGSNIGMLHSEGSGSLCRLGPDTDAALPGGIKIGTHYAESNTFGAVLVSAVLYSIDMGMPTGEVSFAKHVDISRAMSDGSTYLQPNGWQAITIGDPYGGVHQKLKYGTEGSERVDFNYSSTFKGGKQFYTGSDAFTVTLIPPEDNRNYLLGYDTATLSFIGDGYLGEPVAALTFAPEDPTDKVNGVVGPLMLSLQKCGDVMVHYKGGSPREWLVQTKGDTPNLDSTELVANGEFSSDVSGWTGTGLSWSAGQAVLTSNGTVSGNMVLSSAITVVVGELYQINVEVGSGTTLPRLKAGTSSGGTQYLSTGPLPEGGENRATIKATTTSLHLELYGTDPTNTKVARVESISVRKVL